MNNICVYIVFLKKFMYNQEHRNYHYYSLPECTTIKRLYSDGGSDFSNKYLVTRFYSDSSVMSLNRPSLLWPSVATGSRWYHIFTRCYCDHLVAATSDRERHMSPLLLRVITTTIIWWYHSSPLLLRVTATTSRLVPSRSQKLRLTHISTCLQHSTLKQWPRILEKFSCAHGRRRLLFVCASSNNSLMSDGPSLLWALVATAHVSPTTQ
jgi:hypothetical protein